MEVLADIKFTYCGNKSAVVYSWDEYGLKLHVPEGSTASFRARVVHSMKFVFPEDTELASPFYWVDGIGELAGPVGVEIQHCAHIMKGHSTGLQFVVCKVEKPEPPYIFKEFDGRFSNNHGIADIEFSSRFFAIKKAFGLEQRFQARLYYSPYCEQVPYECTAHVVIVPDTRACQVSAIILTEVMT